MFKLNTIMLNKNNFKIGDIVYILYNNEIHSAIITGIKVRFYYANIIASSLEKLINKNDLIYTLVSISDTITPNKSEIATPDNIKHNFKIESIYGEHQYPESKIFSTISDLIKHIEKINNIVV